MPSFFANASNTLTEYSNYLIDWSRVGELISSASHRYSLKELAVRGVIIGSSMGGGYAGYQYSGEDFGLKSGLYSMAGCFVGFVASHTIVIAPLILKRYQMSQETAQFEHRILDASFDLRFMDYDNPTMKKLVDAIADKVEQTKSLSLSDEKHARASQTLGTRKTLMGKMAGKLETDLKLLHQTDDYENALADMHTFWSKPINAFYQALKGFKPSIKQTPEQEEISDNHSDLKLQ